MQGSPLIDQVKLKALAAIRELTMAVDFAEQASDAIEGHAFQASDTEIESSEAALFTARSVLDEMAELLEAMKQEAAS